MDKDYLPQFAAEVVRDLDLLKTYSNYGDIYAGLADAIRSAAHIVLPLNGNIYRDKTSIGFTKEESESSGVMPHVITTFEHPVDSSYFRDSETEIDPANTASAMLHLAIDHKLAPVYDRESYRETLRDRDQMDVPFRRDPLTIISFIRFGHGYYGAGAPRDMRWAVGNYYLSTLIPIHIREVDGRASTELNLLNLFTKESAITYDSTIKVDGESEDATEAIISYMAGFDSVVQACHSLRVGATLEARKEKSYTRNRTLEKNGIGGFEYHVLKLPTGTVKETLGSRVGSDKDGPRYHFRRAHLRTLSKGTQTFVRSCFVGNRDKGVIEKEYKVG